MVRLTFTSLIWPLIDAKRFARMMWVDPIIRLDLLLMELDL